MINEQISPFLERFKNMFETVNDLGVSQMAMQKTVTECNDTIKRNQAIIDRFKNIDRNLNVVEKRVTMVETEDKIFRDRADDQLT